MKINKLMIWVICLLFAALLAGPRAAAAQPVAQDQPVGLSTPEELEAFMDGLVEAQLGGLHVAGMTVSVVRDGELFFAKGYGFSDLAGRVPVSAGETLFRAGSVSKLFVWTSVMQLVEQGRLDLDTDIRTYLDFDLDTAYEEPVTLRHLMTHTPGFEDRGDGLFVRTPEEVHPLRDYLTAYIPRQVYPPGEISAYSNYGATLAAYIVELESGMSFNEYVEANIFAPLGMANSSFRQPLPPELAGNLSTGYLYTGGQYQAGIFEYVQPYPVGSLSTTAVDMTAFMIAHLQNGSYQGAQILEEDTAREMYALQFSHDPHLQGWGLGFMSRRPEQLQVTGHGGDTVYFHSEMQLLLDHNVGIFVSTNTNTGALARYYLVQSFMDRYFPEGSLPQPDPQASFDPARYTGTYFPARMNFSTAEKSAILFQPMVVNSTGEGRLAVSGLLGAGTTYWVPVEEGVFVSTDPDLPIRSPLVFRPTLDSGSGEEGGAIRYAFTNFGAYIKQPWYAGQTLQFGLLGLGMLFFLGAVIAVPVGGLTRRRYERMAPEAIPPMPRSARWNRAKRHPRRRKTW